MPTRKKKSSRKKPAAKRAPRKTRSAKRRASSRTVTQVTQSAIKVLGGATSDAVRAMIPPLEKAAGKIAEASGAKRGRKRSKARA
jgi:hypothetical protein